MKGGNRKDEQIYTLVILGNCTYVVIAFSDDVCNLDELDRSDCNGSCRNP
ncbi:MAG: hypothetical protein KJ600_00440 [Nanoarchaeota archaeon]|nr:hypothetical protein [Nanoarchaeota archaeon]